MFYSYCSLLSFYEQTKHIEIECYFTCHQLKHDTITSPFVPYSLQILDFFFKSHSISHFPFLVGKLSMFLAASSWVWKRDIRVILIISKGYLVFYLSCLQDYIISFLVFCISFSNFQIAMKNSSLISLFSDLSLNIWFYVWIIHCFNYVNWIK